jgi:hypothetical protein
VKTEMVSLNGKLEMTLPNVSEKTSMAHSAISPVPPVPPVPGEVWWLADFDSNETTDSEPLETEVVAVDAVESVSNWRQVEVTAGATDKTKVVHLKRDGFDERSPGDVRIDRKTKWGNPFVMDKPGKPADGSRSEVIAKYREWIVKQPELMASLHELKGKRLGCWCSPEACHGDVLAELVNQITGRSEVPGDATGPACRECGAATIPHAMVVQGWRNFDCPQCGYANPTKVNQEPN